MKNIITCCLLWLFCSCNNQQPAITQTKTDEIPAKADAVKSGIEQLEAERKRREDPAYKDSVDKETQKIIDKLQKQSDEKYSKYTLKDWVDTYSYGLENNLLIENAEVKYHDNYKPYLKLTIKNWGGIGIVSIELLSGEHSKFNDNRFIVKKAIPPRTTVNISVDVPENVAKLPILVYSAIGSTGDRFYCSSARINGY